MPLEIDIKFQARRPLQIDREAQFHRRHGEVGDAVGSLSQASAACSASGTNGTCGRRDIILLEDIAFDV